MDTLNAIWSNDTYRKLILSVLILIAQAVIRRLILSYVINRVSDDNPYIYTIRKLTTSLWSLALT